MFYIKGPQKLKNSYNKIIFKILISRTLSTSRTTTDANTVQYKNSNFKNTFEENHCEINFFQKSLLTAGSAALSIFDPHRGDMIACLGETTGLNALKSMKNRMEQSKEGLEILKNQPRINTKTVNLEYLKDLPHDTLGYAYSQFLKTNGVSPDSRNPVQFINDIELAYIIQRYREIHDLIHTILGMPTNMLGEVTVKWVEAIQFKLPMCVGGAIFGPMRLKPKHRTLYLNRYLPWAIKTGTSAEFLLNIYFEHRWEQNLQDFFRETNIEPLII